MLTGKSVRELACSVQFKSLKTRTWSRRLMARHTRQRTVAVRLLHEEQGLAKGYAAYPTLPDLRLHRCRPRQPGPAPALDRAA